MWTADCTLTDAGFNNVQLKGMIIILLCCACVIPPTYTRKQADCLIVMRTEGKVLRRDLEC